MAWRDLAHRGTRTRYITDYRAGRVWECVRCGYLFNAWRSDAKTCSSACRVWIHRNPETARQPRTGWAVFQEWVGTDELDRSQDADEWILMINLENEALSLSGRAGT